MYASCSPESLGLRHIISWIRSGPNCLCGSFNDNHGSFQTLVALPLPMTLPRFVAIRSLPTRIPRHPWDADSGVLTSKNGVWLQYFPDRVLASKLHGLDTQHIFLFSGFASHQNLVSTDWIRLQRLTGILMTSLWPFVGFYPLSK